MTQQTWKDDSMGRISGEDVYNKPSVTAVSPLTGPLTDLRSGTLGPAGSSSEQALLYFLQSVQAGQVPPYLADSFEDVLAMLKAGDIDVAVVPHAYGNIHNFYMDKDIHLARIFVMPTPVYGLAKRAEHTITTHPPLLVTHPAPLPLLPYLVENPEDYRVEIVSSTSAAAQRVRDGCADVAITNEIARSDNDLIFVNTYGPIVMSWSAFTRANLDVLAPLAQMP